MNSKRLVRALVPMLWVVSCADGALPPRTLTDPANPHSAETPMKPAYDGAAALPSASSAAPTSTAAATSEMPGMRMDQMPGMNMQRSSASSADGGGSPR